MHPDAPEDIRSGLDAYACRQAAICQDQSLNFVNRWRADLIHFGLPNPWPHSTYPSHVGKDIEHTDSKLAGGIFTRQDGDGPGSDLDSSNQDSEDEYGHIRESSFFDTTSEGSDWYSDGL